jgi:hypothetical protein
MRSVHYLLLMQICLASGFPTIGRNLLFADLKNNPSPKTEKKENSKYLKLFPDTFNILKKYSGRFHDILISKIIRGRE